MKKAQFFSLILFVFMGLFGFAQAAEDSTIEGEILNSMKSDLLSDLSTRCSRHHHHRHCGSNNESEGVTPKLAPLITLNSIIFETISSDASLFTIYGNLDSFSLADLFELQLLIGESNSFITAFSSTDGNTTIQQAATTASLDIINREIKFTATFPFAFASTLTGFSVVVLTQDGTIITTPLSF